MNLPFNSELRILAVIAEGIMHYAMRCCENTIYSISWHMKYLYHVLIPIDGPLSGT